MRMNKPDLITIALPKGRIAEELVPVLQNMDIEPEADYFDKSSRKLAFQTSRDDVQLIRVRSFDVPTFVSFGAAQIGVSGSDVLLEHDHPDLYAPLDLKIGACRMSLACMNANADKALGSISHLRIATKYPHITRRHFASKGIQAECIKLNGAIELAPTLGLCDYIIDLVSTGNTLKANGLTEIETLLEVSSQLIVNRTALKTRSAALQPIIDGFTCAVEIR